MASASRGEVAPIDLPSTKEQRKLDDPSTTGDINGHPVTGTDASNCIYVSSDEDGLPRAAAVAEEDEADNVLGVSISHAQSRMKARRTPMEKIRAMESGGGYFDSPLETRAGGEYLPEISAEPEPIDDTQPSEATDEKRGRRTASPTKGSIKEGQRSGLTRSILKGGLPGTRTRAWSGDSIANLKKKLLPDFGSLAKRSSIASFISPGHSRSQSQQSGKAPAPQEADREKDVPADLSQKLSGEDDRDISGDELVSELRPLDRSATAKHSYQRRPSISRTPLSLRRSASDQSLYLRNLSRESSLEQRSQFEHVHSQVNSRFKAIKDTLQDSSNRLLSKPGLALQDLRSDWGYGRFIGSAEEQSDNVAHTAEHKRSSQARARSPKSGQNTLYPILTEAMSELTGDVVIMGGYRGSILRSAKPPHRQLWVPMKVGLNLRKVDLEVGLSHEDEERMEESIIASEVLSHIGPVDICRRLINKLRKCENARAGKLRVWNYGYDWRLSPHLLSKRLIKYLEDLPCNAPDTSPEKRGAYVIAHSLGGLITRHAVNQRPELFAGVVYAGVPQHCVNILGPLRNGDDVLLSSRVLTAQVNFTFRTSYALLPEDGRCFIDKRTKEDYLIDFFNVENWEYYRFSPCIAPPLPPLLPDRRSFIDTIPGALPSFPKIGKRFSSVLGGKETVTEESSAPKSAREQETAQKVPRDNDRKVAGPPDAISAAANKATAGAPTMEGVVGPTSTPRTAATTPSATVSTIPRQLAIEYLRRTLAEVLRFKQELAFNPSHQSENRYPPFSVLYGKSAPTVYGAKVASREHIRHQDAYDDLAYAAGDGVCLASAAMLPPGYRVIKNGLAKSDRGHVGLLGDLEGVGQCLLALVRGRREGVGLGIPLRNAESPKSVDNPPI